MKKLEGMDIAAIVVGILIAIVIFELFSKWVKI